MTSLGKFVVRRRTGVAVLGGRVVGYVERCPDGWLYQRLAERGEGPPAWVGTYRSKRAAAAALYESVAWARARTTSGGRRTK
jgi:hypothetical protein